MVVLIGHLRLVGGLQLLLLLARVVPAHHTTGYIMNDSITNSDTSVLLVTARKQTPP